MNNKIVVSNVRMPYDEWMKIRINAAEMDMSINEYIRFIINQVSIKRELIPPMKTKKHEFPIWKMYELSSKYKKRKGKGISIEDEIIYGEK